MIVRYVTSLKKYHAITADVGLQDGLARQNKQLDQMMSDFGITHTFETYEGDHTNRIPERIESMVLPYFSKNLVSRAQPVDFLTGPKLTRSFIVCKQMIISDLLMEAGGVEPPSEKARREETTCVAGSLFSTTASEPTRAAAA